MKPSLLAKGPATAATAEAEGGFLSSLPSLKLGCLCGGAGEASRRSWRREQEAC